MKWITFLFFSLIAIGLDIKKLTSTGCCTADFAIAAAFRAKLVPVALAVIVFIPRLRALCRSFSGDADFAS